MKNYRSLVAFLLAGLIACTGPITHAQSTAGLTDIDTLLADNEFNDLTARYSSVLLTSFPERGTRLGYSSANEILDNRSPQHSAQALISLRSVREQFNRVKSNKLSEAKRADLQLVLNDLDYMIWLEEQNRTRTSPLYYAEAFDSIYDLLLKQISASFYQRAEILARLRALDRLATQAENYLTKAPPYQAQLAMEKAYYAFLSMDEIAQLLLQGVSEPDTIKQIKTSVIAAKQSVRRLFNLFKKLSKEENEYDFRLGADAYGFLLANQFQIHQKPEALLAHLQKNLDSARKNLTKALDPFMQNPDDEAIAVMNVDAPNGEPAQPSTQKAAKNSKKTKKEKKAEALSLRNAQDFYAVIRTLASVEAPQDPIKALTTDAGKTMDFFNQSGILPTQKITFNVAPMPKYYAYFQAYLFVPPFGNQATPQADFFLRLPAGNPLAKQEQLNRDFNPATRKLMLTGELMPGRYYQTILNEKSSVPRRFYPSRTMANGWSAYAQHLAKEEGYLVTDEELLFMAWNEYLRALGAWTDAKLHLRQLSYTEAYNTLTSEHGLEPAQAETLIKHAVTDPGEALSYQAGLDTLLMLRDKYQKKLGKKFNKTEFNTYVLQLGNITPEYLEKELDAIYK